jgi:biotin carboxyl carrier protein
MSRYNVSVGNRTYQITVMPDHLLVNGDAFRFDMESLNGNGLHMLRHPNRSVEAYLEPDSSGCYRVQIGGQHVSAQVNQGTSAKSAGEQKSEDSLAAPMPGTIIEVQVQEGQQIEESQTLVIQEAMKMQMNLKAPCAGRVRTVHVQAGSQVDKGRLLVSIEPVQS